ncbi:RagB/SusD family nutrient uptake outer membrane protein [Fodinibius salsisoli]|uniref:RagB/SusD family nutrient uptake outer membrane protein n=1 Tax=Fodinibius salsisoli TaxID=2820877 RepID=A0ABT3PKN0_9BACT|nr:RagB/SusD family nutrient uptake outer membrane protein [Fodinibius salsisoli]MCW9706481.1 RagB/SusD family nutrient uptake outer membrane protein [Fodinibius salsisoli]
MDSLKHLGTVLLLALIVGSCSDFLGQVPDDRLTLDQTFSEENTVEDFLADIYSRLPNDNQRWWTGGNNGPWTGASDEAEFVWSYYFQNSVNIGAWDATTGHVSEMWSNYYQGIRSATYFMQNVDQCRACDQGRIIRYKAEARALRAIFYYNLMKIYGPVVMFGNELLPPDASLDQVQKKRTPYDEGVDFVVNQLDSASIDLPATPPNNAYYGRMTKPYLQGIKSNLLLLAASPLYNGNTDYASLQNPDGTQLISQQYDESKWERAANAAKEFIDEYVPGTFSLYRKNGPDGQFSPYLSTRDVVLEDWNSEIIMARPGAGVDQYAKTPYHSGSASENRGAGGLGATQTIVDAYFMENGRPIDDPQSGYQESGFSDYQAPYDSEARRTYNPWTNREPRFYVGITYNGSQWLNTDPQPIITKTWYEGNSGKRIGGNDYTPTGYIVRKNVGVGSGNTTIPMMRLAEIYLNYVEALNEYDPGNPDILEYLNRIRNRAGIPEYGSENLPAPSSQELMREAIRHERQVELAFEDKRYFDTRRWKIAEETAGGPKYGMDINATPESEFYNEVAFEERIFEQKHYLYPIPQDEVNIDANLVQNPGW